MLIPLSVKGRATVYWTHKREGKGRFEQTKDESSLWRGNCHWFTIETNGEESTVDDQMMLREMRNKRG